MKMFSTRATLFAILLIAIMFVSISLSLAQQADSVTPDITIRQEENRTIREYRVNGQLYAIEIQPVAGPSYYLVDDDGDGDFQRSDTQERIAVPSWVLLSW